MYKNVSIESNVRIITKIHGEEKMPESFYQTEKAILLSVHQFLFKRVQNLITHFLLLLKFLLIHTNVYEPAEREMSSDITSQHFNIEFQWNSNRK